MTALTLVLACSAVSTGCWLITGGPVVAFGTLLVGTADGDLVAFRPG